MQLSSISLAITRLVGGLSASAAFTPASLFRSGEQGVWYDPSDIKLNWRRNLLTYSEQFDNAAWVKIGGGVAIVPNATTAPNGTITADKFVGTAVTTVKEMYSGVAVTTAGSVYTASVAAKASEYSWVYVVCNVDGYLHGTYFNLATGEIGNTVGSGSTPAITAIGDGWYRVSSTRSATKTSGYIEIFPAQSNSTSFPVFAGDGTSGIYIWGTQLELGSTATPYQRITDGIQDYLQYQPLPVLYQDAAGTQPVTAVEQPVGLMLDKSKQLVLGSELVTNGDFSQGTTGWTLYSPGASITGGALVFDGSTSIIAGSDIAVNSVAAPSSGKVYKVTYTIVSDTTQAISIAVNGSTTTARSSAGTYVEYVTAGSTGGVSVRARFVNAPRTGSIDNVSVRELPGNHAYQTTSTKRPVLSARVNLLTKTEEFDDAAWVKSGTTVDSTSITSPLGDAAAERVTITANSLGVYRLISVPVALGQAFKLSVWLKAASATTINIGIQGNSNANNNKGTQINITAEWAQYTYDFVAGANDVGLYVFVASTSIHSPFAAIGASRTVDVWGADLRVTNTGVNLPAYQRVNTATDYDTQGFPTYLKFDGIDDALQTNSIDFTATDKMTVFAGVRKLSDAAIGILVELGQITTQTGGFSIANGYLGPNVWNFDSKGTVGVDVRPSRTAPITDVLTLQSSITSPTILSTRINGAASGSNTNSQGSGSFNNLPIYIGARAGTSLFFNGNLYNLIVRGAQSSAAQIESTEQWVNGKTAAF